MLITFPRCGQKKMLRVSRNHGFRTKPNNSSQQVLQQTAIRFRTPLRARNWENKQTRGLLIIENLMSTRAGNKIERRRELLERVQRSSLIASILITLTPRRYSEQERSKLFALKCHLLSFYFHRGISWNLHAMPKNKEEFYTSLRTSKNCILFGNDLLENNWNVWKTHKKKAKTIWKFILWRKGYVYWLYISIKLIKFHKIHSLVKRLCLLTLYFNKINKIS